VIPGSSPTIARRRPTILLNNVDFPTFGRPTIATSPPRGFASCTAVLPLPDCFAFFDKLPSL
jgi:hypothetical protein